MFSRKKKNSIIEGKKHGTTPTANDFEEKLALARSIYHEEKEGVVFIMEMKKVKEGIKAEGLLRVWNAPRRIIISQLAKQMELSSIDMLLIAAEMDENK